MTNFGAFVGADPPAQLALLLHDPLLAFRVLRDSLALHWLSYLEVFVGRLGWLDTGLPAWHRWLALAMLAVAGVAAALGQPRVQALPRRRLIIAAALLLAAAGLFAAQYLTWTVPGKSTVDGVHGRYFLPIALAGAALLPALGGRSLALGGRSLALGGRLTAWPHRALLVLVAAFPLVTLTVVMRAVVLRYYLG
jgi:hypothetical protein